MTLNTKICLQKLRADALPVDSHSMWKVQTKVWGGTGAGWTLKKCWQLDGAEVPQTESPCCFLYCCREVSRYCKPLWVATPNIPLHKRRILCFVFLWMARKHDTKIHQRTCVWWFVVRATSNSNTLERYDATKCAKHETNEGNDVMSDEAVQEASPRALMRHTCPTALEAFILSWLHTMK